MIQKCALIISFLQMSLLLVKTNEIPIYNLRHRHNITPRSLVTSSDRINEEYCFFNKIWLKCAAINNFYGAIHSIAKKNYGDFFLSRHGSVHKRILDSNEKSHFTVVKNKWPLLGLHGLFPAKSHPIHRKRILHQQNNHNLNTVWNTPLHPQTAGRPSSPAQSAPVKNLSIISHKRLKPLVAMAMAGSNISQQKTEHKNMSSINKFTHSLDDFERQFYKITFVKLTAISPVDRQENGMSFVQSGFFLMLTLMALWKEVDSNTRAEIDQCIGFKITDMDNVRLVKHFISNLPSSSKKVIFRQSSRLMLWPGTNMSAKFEEGAAAALKLHVDTFNGTETSEEIAAILNKKVEIDSGGAIHNTFDEDDLSGGVSAVLVTTLYLRASWRAAPTVLNGTWPFHDADYAPNRTVRMIRINDVMNYADLREWDTQALEISYATPGLRLLMLIPRGNSLKSLVQRASNTSIGDIRAKMKTKRVAATLPIYTLRMTLLLPNKLQEMGIPTLVDVSNVTQNSYLRLSHAVQRIMFWAEAGRNAYKDDGIEWDQAPELEVIVDRPYIFFVLWRNITLLNGNFVL